MKAKNLAILVVLALVLVGLARLTSQRNRPAAPADIGRELLPGLPVNNVASLSIASATASTTVARVDGIWAVPDKQNFPANFDRVRNAVIALSELTIVDKPRMTAARRATFGLDLPLGTQPDTRRVTLYDEAGAIVADLLLGNTHLRPMPQSPTPGGGYPDGRYVSLDGGETAFRVGDPLTTFSERSLNWIDTTVLNVESADIAHIELRGPARETLTLSQTNGTLRLADLAAGETLDTSRLSRLQSALAYLTLTDIADAALSDADLGLDAPDIFEARTRDGRVYTVLIGGQAEGDARYVRVSVAGDDPEGDAAAAQRDHRWVYVIPGYAIEALTVSRATIVRPEPPEDADSATEGNTEGPFGETLDREDQDEVDAL